MNVFGWVVLAAAAVAALAGWWAVGRRGAVVNAATTPATPATPAGPAVLVLLGVWAWLLHAEATTPGRLLLLALLARLVGDVLRRAEDDRRVVAGTVAALAGHLAALAGVLALPARTAGWPAVVLVLLLGAAAVAVVRRRALAAGPRVAGPATAYGVVLVLAAALAWGRGATLPATGLTLLAVGELLWAADRLARRARPTGLSRGPALPVAVLMTSQGAAALLSVGLVRPDLGG